MFLFGDAAPGGGRLQLPWHADDGGIRPAMMQQRGAQPAFVMRVQQHLPPARFDQQRDNDRDAALMRDAATWRSNGARMLR